MQKHAKKQLFRKITVGLALAGAFTFAATVGTVQPKIAKAEEWIASISDPADFDYSFAIIGDTQYLNRLYPAKFPTLYDYIIDNAQSKNIAHVFGLGDITDDSGYTEWSNAKKQFARLDGIVPYSLVRGNHDQSGDFDLHFGRNSSYAEQYFDKYFDGYATTAHEFSAGNLDYLVITLDWGPTQGMFDWASEIISDYPNHNVIVTTHSYLSADGNLEATGSSNSPSHYGAHAGDMIWENFISKHKNITMVFCGHVGEGTTKLRQTENDYGNVVSQLLVDPQVVDFKQGGVGLIGMLYFSNEGKNVDFRYYSTINEKYYGEENQYSFTVHTVPRRGTSTVKPSEPTDENKPADADRKEGGCGSVIGAANFALLPAAIGIVLCKKRKQD